MKSLAVSAIAIFAALLLSSMPAMAGPVFLTGHDPDFHSQDSLGAANLLRIGLNYVTNGTFDDAAPVKKFLWVESRISPPGGHRTGELGLTNGLGLTLGTQFDHANAAELATIDLSQYSAIAIASSFGGLLSQAELDELIARKADIEAFINAGGGLLALAECSPSSGSCLADTLGPSPNLFGFLPVTVSSVVTSPPYAPTAIGAAAPFGLTVDDINDPTHNSFGLVGGLSVLDTDAAGVAATLAGNVKVGGGVFTPVPEPSTLLLLGSGLAGLLAFRKRKAS